MKNILVCLEGLNIGGVETFCLTQIKSLKKRGFNPIVVSKKGDLNYVLEENKIKFYEYDFNLSNDFIYSNEFKKFIKKNKIDLVYINQFPCVLHLLPILIELDIPYVAYLHSVVPGTCEWFEQHYPIFSFIFPYYFKNASKIVAVSESIMNENSNYYNIDKNKYTLINNCIDFDTFKNSNIDLKNKKMLWYGRVSEEKEKSIKTTIDLFNCLKEKNLCDSLTIVGDGNIKDNLKKLYVDNKNIKFKNAISDISNEVIKYGIICGVDRCVIESLAMKKIVFLCSYEGKCIYVNSKNIELLSKTNFSGYGFDDSYKDFFEINEKEILNNIESNYNFVFENNNIDNYDIENISFDKYDNFEKNYIAVLNRGSNNYKIIENNLEKTVKDYNNQVLYSEQLREELDSYKNSRFIRFSKKMVEKVRK